MDEIKRINPDVLRDVVARTGFDRALIAKDYYITVLLYLLKDIDGMYFKGGTALHKIFLDYARLSEDIDFTLTKDVRTVKKQIEEVINNNRMFGKITKDKHVKQFVRLIVHFTDPFGEKGTVFIDLNRKAELLKEPEKHKVVHFYEDYIPEFSFRTLAEEEMMAEKVAATIGRNKPRDHFDVYTILSRKIPINMAMVEKKCHSSGDEFDIIKMFNRAKKLKNRWDEDMLNLLADKITFPEVMQTLAKHFKLKEEKEKKKDTKQK